MKNTCITCLIIFLTLSSLQGQIDITGTYYLAVNQLTFHFHPTDPQTGTPWFEVTYANGQRGAAPFYINGDILTLRQFNYGVDQPFRILSYDEKTLMLETMYVIPAEKYQLIKMNTGNFATEHDVQILASVDGYDYTAAHVDMAIRFAEFVCGTRLSSSEREEAKQEGITEFKQNPKNSMEELTGINKQMQQLYQLTDIGQIALARSALVAQLYPAVQSLDDNRLFKRIINKYTPTLSIDQTSGLALTQREVDGFLELNAFYGEMYGQPFILDAKVREQMKSYLIDQFQQGDLHTKQSLCLFSILNEYVQGTYANMTAQQKQQFRTSLSNPGNNNTYSNNNSKATDYSNPENLWPPGIDTPEEKRAYLAKKRGEMQMNSSTYNIMQDMMMQDHATSLNIIENMVPDGDYWQVKYY